jgi:predicted amidohydrolase YtcJ
MPVSRRDFVTALGAMFTARAAVTEPGLILHHANIHTVDEDNPRAEAVAIAGDRFLAVGSNQEVLALATARTRKIDIGNKTIVPGFIDAHTHVAEPGLMHLRRVECDLRSIAEILAAVRQRAAQTPKGEWVLGFKYDDTKTAEARRLTRADLDQAAADHPVFIEHRGGHTAYVNSAALRIADVNDATPDPAGGQFERDAGGRLTGGLRENATTPFKAKIPSNYSRDERRQGVKLMTQRFASAGVTSVHDAEGSPDDLLAYQDAFEAGELRVRVYHFLFYRYIDRMIAAGLRTGMGNEWIRIGGMKLVADGSISERTARLSQPYVGRPSDYGILVMSEDDLYSHARKAHAAGWQIGIHANGDVGIDIALRVYERLQREMPRRDPRFRLEHCTVINDALIRRIKAIGAIPTPFSTYVYYHGEKMREYGADRLNSMFALRSFLDAGIRATQASDYPPGPFEPMMALQSEVTRTDAKGNTWGPKQKITIDEALRVGTLHGAYASFEEKTRGSIAPGKLADLVVLARDPKKEDPSTIVTIPVERTMAGGQWVYES